MSEYPTKAETIAMILGVAYCAGVLVWIIQRLVAPGYMDMVSWRDYTALLAELAELKIQCAAKDSVIATYESDKFGLSRSPDGAQLGVWKKGFPDE